VASKRSFQKNWLAAGSPFHHILYVNEQNFVGVYPSGSRALPYKVHYSAKGKLIYLGSYATAEEAARVYDNAVICFSAPGLDCRFTRLNFPEAFNGNYAAVSPLPKVADAITRYTPHIRGGNQPTIDDVRLAFGNLMRQVNHVAAVLGMSPLRQRHLAMVTAEALENTDFCPKCNRRSAIITCEHGKFSACCEVHFFEFSENPATGQLDCISRSKWHKELEAPICPIQQNVNPMTTL